MALTLTISDLLKSFIILTCLAVATHSQRYRPSKEECEKYCFADCSKYKINGNSNKSWIVWSNRGLIRTSSEFSDCVEANVNCNCESRFSFKNPLLLLALITFGILTIVGMYYFYKRCIKGNPNNGLCSRSAYTNPIVPSANAISAGNFGTFQATNYNGHQISSLSTYDFPPPEYLPPPSYFESTDQHYSINEKVSSN